MLSWLLLSLVCGDALIDAETHSDNSEAVIALTTQVEQEEVAANRPTSLRRQRALVLQLHAYTRTGQLGPVVRLAEEVERLTANTPELAYGGMAALYLGWASQRLRRIETLAAAAKRAVVGYEHWAKDTPKATLPTWAPSIGAALNLYAVSESWLDHPEASVAAFQRAIDLPDLTPPTRRQMLANQAESMRNAGKVDEAEKQLTSVLVEAREVKDTQAISNAALLLTRIKKQKAPLDEVAVLLREAIAAQRHHVVFSKERLDTQVNLAGVLLQLGRIEEAATLCDETAAEVTKLMASSGAEERRDYLAALFDVYHVSFEADVILGKPQKALETFALTRSGHLAEQLGARSRLPLTPVSSATLQSSLPADTAVLVYPPSPTFRSALLVKHDTVKAYQLARLAEANPSASYLAHLTPRWRVSDVMSGSPASTNDVKAGDVIVTLDGKIQYRTFDVGEHLRNREKIEVQMVRDGKPLSVVWKKPLGSFGMRFQRSPESKSHHIEAVIRQTLELLSDADGQSRGVKTTQASVATADLATLLRLLHEVFVKSIEPDLVGIKRIVIMSDGYFASLPWESLIDGQGRVLAERFDVTYAHSPSVREFLSKRRYTTERKPLLALGGAIYNAATYTADMRQEGDVAFASLSRGGSVDPASVGKAYAALGFKFDNLPGTLSEVKGLATRVPGTLVMSGKDVDESKLKKMSTDGELARFRMLHFATHGAIVPEANDLSAIVLSTSEPGAADDGYLRVPEIEKLTLAADVVVLSACETAKGRYIAGEGAVGLVQALLISGANAVVVSLWPVSDEATALLMTATYEAMQRKQLPFASALADAKRRMSAGALGARFKAPHYWAPFVYFGS